MIVRSSAVAVAVIVATAGACQQEWDGPLPPPDELDARPLPEQPGGVDAVYAAPTGPGANGEQCYRVLTFTSEGRSTQSSTCTAEPVGRVLDSLGDPIAIGDYSHRDGDVRVRLVSWDPLAEELVLDEFDATLCGAELRAGSVYELVDGAPPPGTPPCTTR